MLAAASPPPPVHRVADISPEQQQAGGSWLFQVTVRGSSDMSDTSEKDEVLLARKIVLATGIQGGGEWHVPSVVTDSVPKVGGCDGVMMVCTEDDSSAPDVS